MVLSLMVTLRIHSLLAANLMILGKKSNLLKTKNCLRTMHFSCLGKQNVSSRTAECFLHLSMSKTVWHIAERADFNPLLLGSILSGGYLAITAFSRYLMRICYFVKCPGVLYPDETVAN